MFIGFSWPGDASKGYVVVEVHWGILLSMRLLWGSPSSLFTTMLRSLLLLTLSTTMLRLVTILL
ncbi:hypothetical protein, partial [Enterobacter asburiae]|uniref:hypothetical protein n=1 Tax=Enterobacter asburiae TaxID=61645 RepID=UPI001F1569B3